MRNSASPPEAHQLPKTPAVETDAPAWMQRSFALFRQLESLGFQPFPQPCPQRWLEVYPHAAYSPWLERSPFPKQTLECRLQRQLALYERDVDVPDAMRIFEEITRHRLLKGLLPLDLLYTSGELDALVAAYTARQAALHADMVTLLGDPQEGQVVLPGVELKLRY